MRKISLFICFLFAVLSVNAQIDRTQAPKPGPATKLDLGEYSKFELKNGLKVIVVEDHRFPVVSYSLRLDIDPIVEGNKAGYVSFTGDLLRSGTSNYTKSELDEKIDFLGASLSTYGRGIYARSLKKHSAEMLNLMTDVLYHPTFPQEELDKQVKQMLTSIKSDKEEPQVLSSRINTALLFGKETAYGELLTEETVENITVEDCKNYYQTYFKPNVSYLVIVGDVSVKEAKKTAKKYFGQWEPGDVPSHDFVMPSGFSIPKYAVAHKDQATQSYITVSYPIDLKPGSADAIKAKVMNQVFGGYGFSARLMKNIREDKAWTYGAYSSLNTDENCGSFKAYTNVRGTVTDSAFTEVKMEMNRMLTEKVSDEDLQLVKNAMIGSFGRSLEDPSTIADFAVNIDKYNLPANYYETYIEKLEAVTADDVLEMAKKYYKPENALYLAVGDGNVVDSLMQKFAGDQPVTEYDYYANVVEHTGLPEGLTAQNVIDDYITAIGGEEKLIKVKDMSVKSAMKVQGMELAMNSYQKAPNKMCVETLMGTNVLSKQVYDGEKGFMVVQGQRQDLQGEMLEGMKYDSQMFPELNYDDNYQLKLISKDVVDGKEAYKMEIINPVDKSTTVYFDANTGLKLKQVSQTPQGSSIILYEAYKDVEGVMYPVHLNMTVGPQNIDLTVSSVEINKGVDDSVFK